MSLLDRCLFVCLYVCKYLISCICLHCSFDFLTSHCARLLSYCGMMGAIRFDIVTFYFWCQRRHDTVYRETLGTQPLPSACADVSKHGINLIPTVIRCRRRKNKKIFPLFPLNTDERENRCNFSNHIKGTMMIFMTNLRGY